MPYTNTTWVDNSAPDIDAANLNNIEDGISKAPYGPDASANQLPVWNGSAWVYEQISDAQVSASAAIAYSKLALAASIKNADIATAAGIVYTKLNLAGAIQDSDILSTANLHKLAAVTGTPTGTKFLRDDGSWAAPVSPASVLDYAQITTASTSITATSEGTAQAVVTGNSVSYDGSQIRIEVYCAQSGNGISGRLVLLRDSTVLGQADVPANAVAASQTVVFYDTPSAASHVYAVKAFQGAVGTFNILAGAGGSGNLIPVFIRVTRA